MKLSVIIPCKDEEGNVENLYHAIDEALKKIKYEAIFINDGSTDNTMNKLRELYEKDDKHVKVISFSRNFRKEAAMLAGLKYATGEYTAIIDGDLQQNPNYLLEMINVLDNEKEYDEVAMVMKVRTQDSKIMAFFKNAFYNTMNKLCDIELENAASDFRMFRKNVRDSILSLSEKNRFSKGIFAWIGFNVKYLPYEVEPRKSGKSSFNFKNSLSYAIDGILAFSTKPLFVAFGFGFLTLFAFFVYLIVLLVQLLAFHMTFSVSYIIILLILLLAGLQFLVIGFIGQYMSKMYLEVKNRPVYIIKETNIKTKVNKVPNIFSK